ncbi:MAG TPA: hypothetical protein VJ696_05190 [Rhodanobacteraceae bacterium]|nr:hypothetical protein [Rhodanobacteraceae bacterium]
MRLAVVTVLTSLALAACGPSSPPESAKPAATPETPPAGAMKPAENPPGKPAETAAAKPPPPEGDCGDQSALPADQRIANTARWSTASEQDSFSFDVYRSDSEKGEFKKINKDSIMGAGTSDETHKYEYRDDAIDPCKDYWYYIEATSTKGAHEKFTPTFHATAKRRPRGSAGESGTN